MAEPRRYPYRPRLAAMLGASAFFGVCAFVFFQRASAADRAVAFYALLGAASMAFVLLGAYGVVRALGPPGQVVLSDEALELPPAPFRRGRRIPLANVRAIGLWEVNRQKGLRIEHTTGVDNVMQSMLGERAFDELTAELRQRCGPR